MPHIHKVARQNTVEIPRDKDEVNKREKEEEEKKNLNLSGREALVAILGKDRGNLQDFYSAG
jgi:hypothetical protein